MANIFVSSSRDYLIRGIITILTGGLLLFVPNLTMQTVMMVMGGMMVLSGMINMIFSNRRKTGSLTGFWSIQGVFSIVVGLTFIVAPAAIIKIFVVFFGIVLLIMGIIQLTGALVTRSWSGWSVSLIVTSVLTIAGGVLLMNNPFKSAETILILIGIVLILYGISELFMAAKMKNHGGYFKGVPVKDISHEEV